MPSPPQEGEGAPRFDSEADLIDDGPGGTLSAIPILQTRHQKLGLAQLEYRLDRQSNFSAAKPREKVHGEGQLLA
eukprot:8562069-Pyramimonas_sp.AAC.1